MKSNWVFFCVIAIFLGIVAWAGISKPAIGGSVGVSGKSGDSGLEASQQDAGGDDLGKENIEKPTQGEKDIAGAAVPKTDTPAVKEDNLAKEPDITPPAANQTPEAGIKPSQEITSNDVPAQIKVTDMTNSTDPLLRKIAGYEEKCGPVFSRVMIFEDMPVTSNEAEDMATDMAARLKKFAAAGIVPVVSVEPVDGEGEPLQFKDISTGRYDNFFKKYFSVLKGLNISDSQMGIWVPIPEPNLDEWGDANHSPADFVAAFNRYGKIFKGEFGGAKLSVLIDNETYRADMDDTELVSLVPFVTGLDKQLVDSFGLQGYPWTAPADEDPETYHDYDASSFLNAQRAIEAARAVGVNSVWFSTGTFAEMFAGQAQKSVKIDAMTRKKMLDGILGQANAARKAGFDAMILIFAEDKSDTEEATDFSYLKDSGSAQIFCSFAVAASSQGIQLGIYDTY